MLDIEQVLNQHFVKEKIKSIFGSDETELVTRVAEDGTTAPTSFILKRKNEHGLDVERLIILSPPGGYTANMPNWMNSHAETHHAVIEILGGVRNGKASFSKLKDCIELDHAPNADSSPNLHVPYKETDAEGVEHLSLTAGARVHVVKQDGYGFYHNLTNKTNDWLMIKLEKHLRPSQNVELSKFAEDDELFALATEYYHSVQQHGDRVFHTQPDLVDRVVNYPDPHRMIPALIEMLKIYDAGRHEACTVFATLLQMGKQYPAIFHEHAQQAVNENFEPAFYLKQLIPKIERATLSSQRADSRTWVAGSPPKGSGFAQRIE